jgi:hypothetical protein
MDANLYEEVAWDEPANAAAAPSREPALRLMQNPGGSGKILWRAPAVDEPASDCESTPCVPISIHPLARRIEGWDERTDPRGHERSALWAL